MNQLASTRSGSARPSSGDVPALNRAVVKISSFSLRLNYNSWRRYTRLCSDSCAQLKYLRLESS